MVNNLDWFGPMSLLTFLRDIGKFARVGNMMAKESVRTRMESESGISYTEFTYQLLQVWSQGLGACSSGAWAFGRSRYHDQLLQVRRTGAASLSLHSVTSKRGCVVLTGVATAKWQTTVAVGCPACCSQLRHWRCKV